MTSAYKKKLRFVDDPIDAGLIPDECRDEYGVDAVKLVRVLKDRSLAFAEPLEKAILEVSELKEALEAKERLYKGMVDYAAKRELERDYLARAMANVCHSRHEMPSECGFCLLRRDPHDCDKVTSADWVEWALWKEAGDEPR